MRPQKRVEDIETLKHMCWRDLSPALSTDQAEEKEEEVGIKTKSKIQFLKEM